MVKPSNIDADVSPCQNVKPLLAPPQSIMQLSGPFSERNIRSLPPKLRFLPEYVPSRTMIVSPLETTLRAARYRGKIVGNVIRYGGSSLIDREGFPRYCH